MDCAMSWAIDYFGPLRKATVYSVFQLAVS